jgi:methylenetetrahydrofolate dehydrogenase (NADP+)/methenyltetrahydrofolate cyclohydrolase
MLATQRIDGKASADRLLADVAAAAASLKGAPGIVPGLCAVLVGHDPASEVYVRSKGKAATAAGIASFQHVLPEMTSEAELLALISTLNADDQVDGILVQLPLPKHIDPQRVIDAIDPAKDVDGFQPGRGRGDRARPVEHRRQTDGGAAALGELHGDAGSFAQP